MTPLVEVAPSNIDLTLDTSIVSTTSRPTLSSPLYPYRPLDFDTYETRLLILNWETNQSEIEYSLEHVSLFNPDDYVALSYCWGDPAGASTISVDGIQLEVTVNLHLALEAIRHEYSLNKKKVRVWADALCINQKDTEERSQQVRNMGQIYSRATQVFCWTGPCTSGKFREAVNYWIREYHISNSETVPLSLKNEYWTIVNNVFSQPYWKRMWVIQEITLAARATVFYGAHSMEWDEFVRLLRSLQNVVEKIGVGHESAFLDAMHLLDVRERFKKRRRPLRLLEASVITRSALATDPRDKIFALLGLCSDSHDYVPLPNYKQGVDVVFSDMTKAMMIIDGSLDIMLMKGVRVSQLGNSNLPTWTPDWENVWSGHLTFQEKSLVNHLQNSEGVAEFNPVLKGSNNRYLKVKAWHLGEITALGTFINPKGVIKATSTHTPWISSTATLAQHDASLRNSKQSDIELRNFIWQTLTMSQIPDALHSQAQGCFSTLWTPAGRGMIHNLALIAWIDQNAWLQIKQWTLREWSQVTSKYILRNDQPGVTTQIHQRVLWEAPPDVTIDHLANFIDVIETVLTSGMRPACVHGGQPFGMVHPDAQVNDKIYLIHGCTTPVVLRNDAAVGTAQHHSVIGAAYTLGTDPQSSYYRETRNTEDLLDWSKKETVDLTLC